MEIVVLLCVVVALEKATEYATRSAYRSARSAAVARKAAAAKSKRPVTRPGRVGSAVGRGLGVGAAAAFHGGRGFAAGAREGWPAGWQQGRDWHARRQAAKVTPLQAALDPQVSTDAAPAPAGRPEGLTPQVRPLRQVVRHEPKGYAHLAESLTKPRWLVGGTFTDPARNEVVGNGPAAVYTEDDLRARIAAGDAGIESGEYASYTVSAVGDDGQLTRLDPHTMQPIDNDEAHSLATIHEGEDMSMIDTVTGGEVYTMDQLIAELGTIQSEAVAELEDATADAQRAKEDASRIELMVASLAALHLDEQSLGEIGALAEDAQARLSAAEQRQSAAESRAAHAQTAAEGVQARHGAIREHAATMADREFYQG